MGMFDKIRSFFNGNNEQEIPKESEVDKEILSSKILNLIDSIKRINSFDSSIWNLSNVTKYELTRKSVAELKSLESSLSNRFQQLSREKERRRPELQKLEEAKWTGQKPSHLSDHEFDMWQRDD